ncbi:FG-GAP repeat protein [Nitrosococcus halophilus Nc 4]|uniref:FG-GAP repeat protein n=1 Tax=Nitrosococcus halophilus (strain Nc4) TaxID=472759 RepID=D5C092_NITHN|nr:FG-GAP repeat protein [Nitrosococcus halophilus]ADE14418.1 FG-GAP repeat protein [Nitrosococcus halophilus Nc 4]
MNTRPRSRFFLRFLLAFTFNILTGQLLFAADPDPGLAAEGGTTKCCIGSDFNAAGPWAPTEAIAFGDFNGDGYQDAALGMPSFDVDNVEDAGAVRVLYGSSEGLTTTDDPSVDLELWDQDRLEVSGSGEVEAGDRFGASLAVGDFNQDGYEDLAIGSPGEDSSAFEDSGQVDIIHGSPSGLVGCHSCNNRHETLVRETFVLESAGTNFGSALAAGDFHGDGYPDLAIGSPGEVNADGAISGGVFLYTGSYSESPQWWYFGGVTRHYGIRSGFGSALAVGNFNGDKNPVTGLPLDDLAVGAPHDDVRLGSYYSFVTGGTVLIYEGSADGLKHDKTFHQDDPLLPTCSSYGNKLCEVGGRLEDGDQFGASLAVGNFDGDYNPDTNLSLDDLAIGVPGEGHWLKLSQVSAPGPFPDGVGKEYVEDAGAVNVIFGTRTGLEPQDNRIWHQDNGFDHTDMPDKVEAGDGFGSALAAGDFNDDLRDELAVGVPYEDLEGIPRAGLVHVLLGSSTLKDLEVWPHNRVWNHLQLDNPIRSNDWFGDALGAGDVNGDGKIDLAIAAPVHADVEGSVAHVLWGTRHHYGPGWNKWQSWYEATNRLEEGP